MAHSSSFVVACLWLVACTVPTPSEFCNLRAEKQCQAPDASAETEACIAEHEAAEKEARAAGCDDEYANYLACLGSTLDEVTTCPDEGIEMDARLRGRCHSENRFVKRCVTGVDPDRVDAGTVADASTEDAEAAAEDAVDDDDDDAASAADAGALEGTPAEDVDP